VPAFVAWALEVQSLDELRAGIAAVPDDAWPGVRAALEAALTQDGAGEPSARERTVGISLAERMRSPVALFQRQVRLERLRIVGER
jgi:hypothetical protein